MKKYQFIYTLLIMISFLLFANNVSFGEVTVAAPAATSSFSSLDILYGIIALVIILFVLIIAILSMAVLSTIKINAEKLKNNTTIKSILLFFVFNGISFFSMAETAEVESVKYPMLNNWELYFLISIILILFFVILTLVKIWSSLMNIKVVTFPKISFLESKNGKTFFQRFNNTVAIEDEDSLDLAHNYDGIRELDNKVPTWWSWTFVTSIVFGFVYMYQMFNTQAIPSQYVELARENAAAELIKKEYLKTAANNIDENSVVMLDANGIANGATTFSKNCVACHGDKGQGNTVGPNLTDAYWLHKGSLKDIFYSIKYGWQEKGMKPWKDDFSPSQIAELASYISSLQGTNPAGAKEKQGELYLANAEVPVIDSVKK